MSKHTAIAATSPSVLSAITLPTPKPGAGEVLVRMKYAILVPLDTYQLDKGLNVNAWPNVFGLIGSGEVSEVGDGVDGLNVGDQVGRITLAVRIRLINDINSALGRNDEQPQFGE